MYKSATKCNETIGKWCKNKHGASKIIDTFDTYHPPEPSPTYPFVIFFLQAKQLGGALGGIRSTAGCWTSEMKAAAPDVYKRVSAAAKNPRPLSLSSPRFSAASPMDLARAPQAAVARGHLKTHRQALEVRLDS
jgi:hypothetical protein